VPPCLCGEVLLSHQG